MKDDLTPADCSPDSLGGMRHVDGAAAPFPGPPLEAVTEAFRELCAAAEEFSQKQAVARQTLPDDLLDIPSVKAGLRLADAACSYAEKRAADGRAEGGTTGASPGNAAGMPPESPETK